MLARWGTFAVGLWLMLAPLVLGYGSVVPILHDVALGLLVCIATLGALEWPPFRFALLAPAAWLLRPGRGGGDRNAALAELLAGVLVAALALVPSARFVPRARVEEPAASAPRGHRAVAAGDAAPPAEPADRAGARV